MTTIAVVPELTKIEFTSFVFSGGEVQVKITNPNSVSAADALRITAQLVNSNSIFELALLVDAIRRINPHILLHLHCPYFPAARQDRVMVAGEALALRVMTDFINNLNFTTVTVWDAHSDTTLALLNRVINIGPENFLDSVLSSHENEYVLVSPDAGAMKKVEKVAKKYKVPMIVGGKHRNPSTGEIAGSYINYDPTIVGDRKLLIVDDLIDGGATYIHLSQAIKQARTSTKNSIELYITHGIFSKGFDVLRPYLDKIYVANPFPSVDVSDPLLEVV